MEDFQHHLDYVQRKTRHIKRIALFSNNYLIFNKIFFLQKWICILNDNEIFKVTTLRFRIDEHARLFINLKKSILLMLIRACSLINFPKKFLPAWLFGPARLLNLPFHESFKWIIPDVSWIFPYSFQIFQIFSDFFYFFPYFSDFLMTFSDMATLNFSKFIPACLFRPAWLLYY